MSRGEEIREALDEAVPDGSIVTNWIIVVETTDGLSNELHMVTSEGMTPWLAYGMLAASSQIAASMPAGDDD